MDDKQYCQDSPVKKKRKSLENYNQNLRCIILLLACVISKTN